METATTDPAAPPKAAASRQAPRKRVIVVVVAFFVLLLLSSGITVSICGDAIESDLRERAGRAVASLSNPQGGSWEIAFDGRDGTVTGEVFDREVREALTSRVRALPGVRVLDDKAFRYREMAEPWLALAVAHAEKTITASGMLPAGGEWKTRVLKSLHAPETTGSSKEGSNVSDLREWRVESQLEENEDVFEPSWTGGIPALVTLLVENPRAEKAVIREGRVTLEGGVYSSEARDALSIAVDSAFRESGLATENRFRILDPPVPPTFSLVWNAERDVTLAGTVADADAKTRMDTFVRDGLPPGDHFSSALAVGENTAEATWEEGVSLLIPGLVGETRSGSLTVAADRVRVTGEIESEEMRESLQEMTKLSFPEDGGYQFDIALTVHIPPRPAIMSVIHMAEAGVKLKGVVGDEATRKAFIALAREHLSPDTPLDTEQIEIERNTMEPGWMPAFASILPGFVANSTRGGLTVYENSLVIEAEVPTEAKWDAVWQLSENFFPDPDFTRDVQLKVVDPSLPPAEDGLGPVDPDDPPPAE